MCKVCVRCGCGCGCEKEGEMSGQVMKGGDDNKEEEESWQEGV